MPNKIEIVLEIIIPANYDGTSILVATRTEDGKRAAGIVSGGPSNCSGPIYKMVGCDYSSYISIEKEIGVAKYNKLSKCYKNNYLGSTPEEIIPKIIKQWEQ